MWSEWPSAAQGNNMISVVDCNVAVIYNTLLSGRTFNKMFIFVEF